MYVAVSHDAGESRWDPTRLDELRTRLAAGVTQGFRWRIHLASGWPFFLAPVEARESLLDLFDDYPFPSPEQAEDLQQLRTHYDSVSASLALPLEPPDLVLTLAANGMMERAAYPQAVEVLDYLVELYPSSLNGPWNLANVYRLMGDTATAIRYYEECLRRDPDLVPARTWIRRLKGGGDP